jgi:hypothetical protein
MSHPNTLSLILLLLALDIGIIRSQDIERTGQEIKNRLDKDPIKLNGQLAVQGIATSISGGVAARYNPFTARVMASMQLDFLGIQAPFSLVYSNGNTVYRLPSYQFMGISPSYKWAKLHFGDRTINFSPYTFSGQMFKGIGTELNPGQWRLAAFSGRLKRAIAEDRQFLQGLDPSFRRTASGLKLGFENSSSHLSGTVFKATDHMGSIPLDSNSMIRPADNLVLAMEGSRTWGPFRIEAEWARNFLSRDKRAADIPSPGWKARAWGLYKPNLSTVLASAFQLKTRVKIKKATWTTGFERVDPGYYSLGTLYFQNDFENITTGLEAPLWKQKINFSIQSGFQRTFLKSDESNRLYRWLLSMHGQIAPSTRMNAQINYSNFNYTTRMRAQSNPLAPVDSISLLSSQSQASAHLVWGINKSQSSLIGLSSTFQQGQSILNDQIQQDKTKFLAVNIYHMLKTKTNWQWNGSIQYHASQFTNIGLVSLGPSIQISKSLFQNKCLTSLQWSQNEVFQESSHSHRVINLHVQARWEIKKQDLMVRTAYTNRRALQSTGSSGLASFREFLTELTYQIRF